MNQILQFPVKLSQPLPADDVIEEALDEAVASLRKLSHSEIVDLCLALTRLCKRQTRTVTILRMML